MNHLPENLLQLVSKSVITDLWRPASAIIPHFQSLQGNSTLPGMVCFSHQFLSSNVLPLRRCTVNNEPAFEEIRKKPTLAGSSFLRDIAKEVVRLKSRTKETFIVCACVFSTSENATHSKKSASPWKFHPENRLQTAPSLRDIQPMCFENRSFQRQMGNT